MRPAFQPLPELPAGLFGRTEDQAVEDAGAILGRHRVVRGVQVQEDGELVLHAVSLDRGHPQLDDLLPAALIRLRVLLLGPHRCDDVAGALEHGVHQVVVPGGHQPPGRPGVLFFGGGGVVQVQYPAGAGPGVAEAVDYNGVVAGLFGSPDGLGVLFGRERRRKLAGVVGSEVRVQRRGAPLRVDHRDLPLRPDQAAGDEKCGVSLAGAGGAGDA